MVRKQVKSKTDTKYKNTNITLGEQSKKGSGRKGKSNNRKVVRTRKTQQWNESGKKQHLVVLKLKAWALH